jgi:hypothetical protein
VVNAATDERGVAAEYLGVGFVAESPIALRIWFTRIFAVADDVPRSDGTS